MSFVNIPCVALKGSTKNQDAVVGVHGHTSQYNPSVTENTYMCEQLIYAVWSKCELNGCKKPYAKTKFKAMYGECGTDKGFRLKMIQNMIHLKSIVKTDQTGLSGNILHQHHQEARDAIVA